MLVTILSVLMVLFASLFAIESHYRRCWERSAGEWKKLAAYFEADRDNIARGESTSEIADEILQRLDSEE